VRSLNPDEHEGTVFGDLDFEAVTRRSYLYLCRETAGNIPLLAERAGISKSTAYDWRKKHGSEFRTGGPEIEPG
jgi:hypothetical protein